ncbi:MAG: hypothetical protein K0U16_07280 [Gammaproteobacteria bacterium]|nr:hypothetical protein [Gammaproteobacteria bacterium]
MPVAHFILTGEAMTSIARQLLLDDEPGKAYRVVADGLVGDGANEAALGVLRGTHELVGDSQQGLELVQSSADDFQTDVAYLYAGRFRDRGKWYRPVAQIGTFGTRDGDWALKKVDGAIGSPGTRSMRRWWFFRAFFYCSDGEVPHLLELDGESTWVIFEPCGEPPHWHRPSTTAQEALDEAIATGRSLSERNADPYLKERPAPRPSREAIRKRIAEADRREEERRVQLEEYAAAIRAQAGSDTVLLVLKDGRELTVPRAPFVRWALARTDLWKFAPEWKNVTPSGLKLAMDNPDHTDWVLGAGLTLDEAYESEVTEAAWDVAHEFQEAARSTQRPYPGIFTALEHLDALVHTAAVLVDAGDRRGTVGTDIAVFPDADASRAEQLEGIAGVVVETGGKLAHFAIVTKGRGITVMRHPDACKLFSPGTQLELNPKTGRIVILED